MNRRSFLKSVAIGIGASVFPLPAKAKPFYGFKPAEISEQYVIENDFRFFLGNLSLVHNLTKGIRIPNEKRYQYNYVGSEKIEVHPKSCKYFVLNRKGEPIFCRLLSLNAKMYLAEKRWYGEYKEDIKLIAEHHFNSDPFPRYKIFRKWRKRFKENEAEIIAYMDKWEPKQPFRQTKMTYQEAMRNGKEVFEMGLVE